MIFNRKVIIEFVYVRRQKDGKNDTFDIIGEDQGKIVFNRSIPVGEKETFMKIDVPQQRIKKLKLNGGFEIDNLSITMEVEFKNEDEEIAGGAVVNMLVEQFIEPGKKKSELKQFEVDSLAIDDEDFN